MKRIILVPMLLASFNAIADIPEIPWLGVTKYTCFKENETEHHVKVTVSAKRGRIYFNGADLSKKADFSSGKNIVAWSWGLGPDNSYTSRIVVVDDTRGKFYDFTKPKTQEKREPEYLMTCKRSYDR